MVASSFINLQLLWLIWKDGSAIQTHTAILSITRNGIPNVPAVCIPTSPSSAAAAVPTTTTTSADAKVVDVSAINSLCKENEDLQSAIAEWKRKCAEWERKAKFWEKYAGDQLKMKNDRIRELEDDVEVLEGVIEEQISELTKADIAGVEHSSALEDALDDAVYL